jgi:uncharacterized protein
MANSTKVMSMLDVPMWESIAKGEWAMQRCRSCGVFRYPPSPICADCHDMEYEWVALEGTGTLLSWTRFHRKYFDNYPVPYNAVTVRLSEGPIIVTNLVGAEPERSSIGRAVRIVYEEHLGKLLPRVRFANRRVQTAGN